MSWFSRLWPNFEKSAPNDVNDWHIQGQNWTSYVCKAQIFIPLALWWAVIKVYGYGLISWYGLHCKSYVEYPVP